MVILLVPRKLAVFISSSQTQWLFLGRESWSCSVTSLLSCVQSRIHHQHSTGVDSGLFNLSSCCRPPKVPSLSHLQEFAQVSMLECCVHTKMNPLSRYSWYVNCRRHNGRFWNLNHRFPLLWSSREAWRYSTDRVTSAFSAWHRLTGEKSLMPPKRLLSLYRWHGWGMAGFWKCSRARTKPGWSLGATGRSLGGAHMDLQTFSRHFCFKAERAKRVSGHWDCIRPETQTSNSTSHYSGSSWGQMQSKYILGDSCQSPLPVSSRVEERTALFFFFFFSYFCLFVLLSAQMLIFWHPTVSNSSPQVALWSFKLIIMLISKHSLLCV